MSSQVIDMLEKGALRGSGILEHLCELIRNLLSTNNQLKSLNDIEVLSYFLKTHAFRFNELLQDRELRKKISAYKRYAAYIENLNSLVFKLSSQENNHVYTIPDLSAEYEAFKAAGISIGQKNCYYITKSMRLLAIKNNVKEIRFWGKILGKKDCFVIQGISNQPYAKDPLPSCEAYGTGVNSYSYWVTSNVLGEWSELPLVNPAQVKASKQFKYIFSGDLERKLSPIVGFEGQQKHLLKCVIARITHSCLLAPKGLYKVGEADQNAVELEESEQGFKLPEVNDLATLENWIHLPPNIMQNGRTSHYFDPLLKEEEVEAMKAELEAKDPPVERLKGIAEDKPYDYNGYTAAANWTVQQCGWTIPVGQIGKQEGQSAVYGVALLKNLTWPGSATVGYRGGWTSIYVGYGHKTTQQTKIIKQLADLQVEGVDINERSEPNPSKPIQEKKDEPAEGAQGGQPAAE